jgi:hypothetical protein
MEKVLLSEKLHDELSQNARISELEQWIAEHAELCRLCSSLSFSQQKARENFNQLIVSSAKYGQKLISRLSGATSVETSLEASSDLNDFAKLKSNVRDALEKNSGQAASLGSFTLGIGAGSERMGPSMIPLSGFTRFEDRSHSRRTSLPQTSNISTQNSAMTPNQIPAAQSMQPTPVPSKTYIRKLKKN